MSTNKNLNLKEAFALAIQEHQKKNLHAAHDLYNQILKIEPNHINANNNLGVLLQGIGRSEEAITYFQQVIKHAPNHAKACNNLGNVYHQLGKNKEAINFHEKAIEIDPNYIDAYYCLGVVFTALNSNTQKELSCYKKVLELDPNHASANYNLAHIFQKLANYPEAIKHYEKAIAISPNNTNAYNNLGTVFKETGEYQKSLDCYKNALSIDPNNALVNFKLGEILYSHGQNEEAIPLLRKVNTLKSRNLILSSLYKLGDETLFFRELDEHIKKGEINATIGSLVSRSGIRFKNKKQNLFCEDPLKFTLKTDLTKVCDFNNIFVEPIKDILKKDILSSRRQDLLTNGLQTGGNLFDNEFKFLEKIKAIIISEVEKYRLHFKNNDEGFLKYWPTDFNLKGWIVNMKSGGKLSPHMHEQGWVSGSIYINVPPKLKDDSGNLVLSIMGDEEKSGLSPKKIMDVATGSLCFFPASLLHYTIPFESDEERIVLAFDISPK